ncbi:hypothetical protein O3M35_012818 [Rhynocoris fuscipes]|uniref:Uncharacterized protein n=1 Tax=Rhynocoris fuscipes TaxID=488301 RepID=A0AAW1CFW2_9HEMI
MRRIEADMQSGTLTDKRPKLERAHSAAEKENQPLVRSSSVLRRQYSQQEQAAREEEMRYYRSELEGLMRSQQQYQPSSVPAPVDYRNDSFSSEQSSSMDCGGPPPAPPGQQRGALVPTIATKKHKRSGSTKKYNEPQPRHQQQLQQQRSFSSSEEELRSTPECTSCEEHENDKGESLFNFSLKLILLFQLFYFHFINFPKN